MLCPIIIILGVCFLGLHYLVGSTSGSSFLLGTCSYTELNKESFEISPHYQSQFLLVLDTSLSMLILIFAGSKTMLEYWIVALINSNHLVTGFNIVITYIIMHLIVPLISLFCTLFGPQRSTLTLLHSIIFPSFSRLFLLPFWGVTCIYSFWLFVLLQCHNITLLCISDQL